MRETNARTMGDCDCCTNTEVMVTRRNNSLYCPSCIQKEDAAIASQKAVETIEKSHEIDATVQLEKDIFNAGTTAFTVIQAAIENNAEIPTEKKGYALVLEAVARIKQYDAAILATKKLLVTQQNERHGMFSSVHDAVAKLKYEEREKFKSLDLSYEPAGITKREKSSTPTTGSTPKYKRSEVNEAATKYNVNAQQIQFMVTARNISPEAAGRELNEMRKRKQAAQSQTTN